MLDVTMSVVAGGKILVQRARDEEMPEGWMIDSEGNTVTDPDAFIDRHDDTAVMPVGGFQFGAQGLSA